VRELGRDVDLSEKAMPGFRPAEVGLHDLHRHTSIVLRIKGEKHDRHAALAHATVDAIIAERGLEACVQVGHQAGARPGRMTDSAAPRA
jgi:hypothetical protein